MANRNFDEWLSKFRPSISSYDYYIDFEKVVRNVEEIKVELNILNSLIGSKNIEEDFEKIITKRKMSKRECFEHIHPEIIPLFKTLKAMNIKIGLITNCYFEESEVIKNSVFFEYFDSVCMSCEIGVKKPDTRIFEKCMRDLDVAAKECLYVGDGGSFELETAKSLGMHPLQATWYLKDGVNQPAKRKKEFMQAESPLEVISEINRYKEYC